MLTRRSFLGTSVIAAAGGSLLAWLTRPALMSGAQQAAKASPDETATVTVIQFSDSGQNLGPARVKKVRSCVGACVGFRVDNGLTGIYRAAPF